MLGASIKEYELLKSEVQHVKDCITKYVGYIVGSNGIAYLIFGYLSNIDISSKETANNVTHLLTGDMVLVVEMLTVLAIYYLINYKFTSHNRYIGYMQLLSQEINHSKIVDDQSLDCENLDAELSGSNEDIKAPEAIFAWEYVNSKWQSRTNPKDYPKSYFGKLDLRLQLPGTSNSYYVTLDGSKQNLIQMFFEHIVWKLFNFKSKKFYNKYSIESWRYVKHIFILFSFLLSISIIFLFVFSSFPKPFLYTFVGIVILAWLFFLKDCYRLLRLDKTIDYYCWSFLPYRTKLLNNYNIRPIFHSTAFQRYQKSLKIAELIDKIQNSDHARTYVIKEIGSKNVPIFKDVIDSIKKGLPLSKTDRDFVKWIKNSKKSITQRFAL